MSRATIINLLNEIKMEVEKDLNSIYENRTLTAKGSINCINELLTHAGNNVNYFKETVNNIISDLDELINNTEDQNDFLTLTGAKTTCKKVLIRIKGIELSNY